MQLSIFFPKLRAEKRQFLLDSFAKFSLIKNRYLKRFLDPFLQNLSFKTILSSFKHFKHIYIYVNLAQNSQHFSEI